MMKVFFSLLGALVADGHASASSAVKQRREDVFAQGVGDNWDKEWQSVDVHGIWSYLVPVFCSTKKKRIWQNGGSHERYGEFLIEYCEPV